MSSKAWKLVESDHRNFFPQWSANNSKILSVLTTNMRSRVAVAYFHVTTERHTKVASFMWSFGKRQGHCQRKGSSCFASHHKIDLHFEHIHNSTNKEEQGHGCKRKQRNHFLCNQCLLDKFASIIYQINYWKHMLYLWYTFFNISI